MTHRALLAPVVVVTWIACGGETPAPAPPPAKQVAAAPTAIAASTGTVAAAPSSGATPPAPPSVDPDVPQGADAARDVALVKDADEIYSAFGNSSPALTADGSKVVFQSSRDGLTQLYVGDATKPESTATRLVTLSERIGDFALTPDGKSVVFMSDKGADENWSIFKVGIDGAGLTELTPGETLHRDGIVFVDGVPGTIAYRARSNKEKNARVFVQSLEAGAKPRLVYTDTGSSFLVDVSRDGKQGLMLRLSSLSESQLLLVDLTAGSAKQIWPAEGKSEFVGNARFSVDDALIYFATDAGGEEADLVALGRDDLKEKARYVEKKPATARIESIAVPRTKGDKIAVQIDAGNHGELRLLDGKTLKPGPVVQLPLGTGGGLEMSDDGSKALVHWSTPDHPTDLYAIDVKSGKDRPLRKESRPTLAKLPHLKASITEMTSFDGVKVPVNLYLPEKLGKTAKLPTLVIVHGGPASSYEIRWSSLNRFFSAHGWAIVEPNVRGSTGFGRKYEQGDDYKKRMDAVRDVEEVGKWASKQPFADEGKLVILGGSYGGYMTLMGVTNHPKLWKAGVDLFGIYSWRTFMTSTSGVIRDIFQKEVGPETDGAFLDSISPAAKIDQVVAPLFVFAGANDPRVPRSESDAIVKNLRERKIPVEYMVAANEGHSLDHKENYLGFLSRAQRFLETQLKIAKKPEDAKAKEEKPAVMAGKGEDKKSAPLPAPAPAPAAKDAPKEAPKPAPAPTQAPKP
ncbi:MAG: S9 family peptidase [Polyangiales bacterium]